MNLVIKKREDFNAGTFNPIFNDTANTVYYKNFYTICGFQQQNGMSGAGSLGFRIVNYVRQYDNTKNEFRRYDEDFNIVPSEHSASEDISFEEVELPKSEQLLENQQAETPEDSGFQEKQLHERGASVFDNLDLVMGISTFLDAISYTHFLSACKAYVKLNQQIVFLTNEDLVDSNKMKDISEGLSPIGIKITKSKFNIELRNFVEKDSNRDLLNRLKVLFMPSPLNADNTLQNNQFFVKVAQSCPNLSFLDCGHISANKTEISGLENLTSFRFASMCEKGELKLKKLSNLTSIYCYSSMRGDFKIQCGGLENLRSFNIKEDIMTRCGCELTLTKANSAALLSNSNVKFRKLVECKIIKVVLMDENV